MSSPAQTPQKRRRITYSPPGSGFPSPPSSPSLPPPSARMPKPAVRSRAPPLQASRVPVSKLAIRDSLFKSTASSSSGPPASGPSHQMPLAVTNLASFPSVQHDQAINVLVIVLGLRDDSRGKKKDDFYLLDPTSVHVSSGRRKTVLSVWRNREDFRAIFRRARGATRYPIFGLTNVQVNKQYEENVGSAVLQRQSKLVPHGHLNMYWAAASRPVTEWCVWDQSKLAEWDGYDRMVQFREELVQEEEAKKAQGEQKSEEQKMREELENQELAAAAHALWFKGDGDEERCFLQCDGLY